MPDSILFVFGIFIYICSMGLLKNLLIGDNQATRNMFYWLGDGQPIITEDSFDYTERGYMAVGAVYECVDLIMKKVLACPVIGYRIKNQQGYKRYENLLKSNNPNDVMKAFKMKAEVMEEFTPPNISKLLEEPNPNQSWDDFVSMITTLYLITGNSLVYGNASEQRKSEKKWSEIWALPFAPKDFTIESGGIMDPIKAYKVSANGGDYTLNFTPEEILHIKTINPNFSPQGTQLYGLSPLKAYIPNLIADKYGANQAAKILKNGMKVGLLSPEHKEDQLTAEQKDNLGEKLRSVYGSDRAMDRMVPVSIAMKYTEIGLDIGDMKLLELSKANREDIYRAYHVPLTYAYNESSTFNNKATDGKQFIYQAVAPIADAISKSLTKFICDPYKKDGKMLLKLDYMSLPEMSVDMKETAEWMAKAWWIRGNEKRYGMGYSEENDEALNKIYPPKSGTNENSNNNENK